MRIAKKVGNGRVLNEFRINSYPYSKEREMRSGMAGGGVPRRRELAGASAITSKAITAPANEQVNRLKDALRLSVFIHSQAAARAQERSAI